MKIQIGRLMLALPLLALCLSAHAQKDNTLSKKEKSAGWQLLFDGKTFNGWKNIRTGAMPDKGWTIADGAMSVPDNNNKTSVGDIVTDRKFRNFELLVDFRYTDGANSGIKYFVNEGANGKISNVACEYQVLDDLLHPDATKGVNGNRKIATLYDVLPANVKKAPKAGEWNTARIVVKGKKVEHWLNGALVLSYERGSDAWKAGFATSKFTEVKDWGMADEGYILLQDHGKVVSFKNIKIKELK